MENSEWRYVAATAENDAVAILASGAVILVRYQTTPRHYLGQVARVGLGAPVHVKGDQAEGLLAVADGDSTLHLFETDSLNVRAKRKLPAAVSNDVFMAGEWIVAETGRSELHCLARDDSLSTVWTMPLKGASLAGRPLFSGEQLLVPLQDGRVLVVNATDGTIIRTIRTGQGLASGPFNVGGETFVASLDGSLVRLSSALVAPAEGAAQ
jgi:outer membrane protein assembly factor BamB